jgi:hypothetical protein
MALSTVAAGKNISAKWTPDGGAEVTLCVTDFDFSLDVDAEDITDSCSSGYQVLLANIRSATGTLTGNYDASSSLAHSATLVGTKGIVKMYLTASKYFTIPIMITKTPFKAAVRGKVTYSWEFQLSGDAGTLAYT